MELLKWCIIRSSCSGAELYPMCKFVAFLIETLNHDDTISNLLDPVEKINSVLKKYGQR